MKKIRITVPNNSEDPAGDLRMAARVRRDLWARTDADIEPEGSRHRTRRDEGRNAYFEFATDRADEIRPKLDELGYGPDVRVTVLGDEVGSECLRCGHSSGPEPFTVCPHCAFRDVSPCPHCGGEVAVERYVPTSGEVFVCPICHLRVRMRLRDQAREASAGLAEPAVVVEPL